MELKNSKWLITGGTSGLGLALSEILIQNQARVAIVARNSEKLGEVSKRLGVIPIQADLNDKNGIYKIAGQAFAQLGGLDVLVNNASDLGPTPLRLLIDTDCEDFEKALTTNLIAPFRLTKAILPALLLAGQGTVVNISSDAAQSAYPRWGAYGSSKAALDHMTRIWSEELKENGIRFLALDPGDMATPMHRAAIPDADFQKLKSPRTSAQQLIDVVMSGSNEVRRSL